MKTLNKFAILVLVGAMLSGVFAVAPAFGQSLLIYADLHNLASSANKSSGSNNLVGANRTAVPTFDTAGNMVDRAITAGYVVSPSSIVSHANTAYEADVLGAGKVTLADWVKVGRFAAGLDPQPTGLQYQEADCAPRSTLGSGKAIGLADWVEAGRYAAGLDALTPVGGPSAVNVTLVGVALNTAGVPQGDFAVILDIGTASAATTTTDPTTGDFTFTVPSTTGFNINSQTIELTFYDANGDLDGSQVIAITPAMVNAATNTIDVDSAIGAVGPPAPL